VENITLKLYTIHTYFARFQHKLKTYFCLGISQPGRIVTVCYYAPY